MCFFGCASGFPGDGEAEELNCPGGGNGWLVVCEWCCRDKEKKEQNLGGKDGRVEDCLTRLACSRWR